MHINSRTAISRKVCICWIYPLVVNRIFGKFLRGRVGGVYPSNFFVFVLFLLFHLSISRMWTSLSLSLFLMVAATTSSAASNPWDKYNLSPATRELQPVSIVGRPSSPVFPFTLQKGATDFVVLDFGKEVGGFTSLLVASAFGVLSFPSPLFFRSFLFFFVQIRKNVDIFFLISFFLLLALF